MRVPRQGKDRDSWTSDHSRILLKKNLAIFVVLSDAKLLSLSLFVTLFLCRSLKVSQFTGWSCVRHSTCTR